MSKATIDVLSSTRHMKSLRNSGSMSAKPGCSTLCKAAVLPVYVVASGDSKAFDDPGIFVEIPLVNQIRPRIMAWREAGYPGVTSITKRLLEHWRDPEEFETRRFCFCQLEAIETLIWLLEAPAAERVGIDVPGDGGPSCASAARWLPVTARATCDDNGLQPHRNGYLDEWTQAVTAQGGFGTWRWAVAKTPGEIRGPSLLQVGSRLFMSC